MKKIISSILLTTFIFQFNTINVLAEELNNKVKIINENEVIEGDKLQDIEAPEISNLVFNESVIAGQTISISVDVKDEISKVTEVLLNYTDNEGTKDINMQLVSGYTYKVDIETTEFMAYQEIKINSITTFDELNNKKTFNITDNNDINTVINIRPQDGINPNTKELPGIGNRVTINNIEFNKKELKVDDILEMTFDINYDMTQIQQINVSYNIGDNWYSEDVSKNNNGEFKLSKKITSEMIYRKVKINSINFTDNEGNTYYIYEYLSNYYAIVVDQNGNFDNEPPIFKDFKFSKNTLNIGDKLEVFLTVEDNLSGIKTIDALLNLGNQQRLITFMKTDVPGVYKDTLDITGNMKYYTIDYSSINIYDNSDNCTRIYSNTLNQKAIVLDENGNFDNKAPILKNIEINKKIAKPGDSVDIIFDAEDDLSGINSINISYTVGNDYYNDLVFRDSEGKFKYQIQITEDMLYKRIKLNEVRLSDNAGNNIVYSDTVKSYYVDIPGENGLIDTKSPQINSVSVNTKSPKVGDVFELYIDASDDASGINNIEVMLNINNYIEGYAEYDSSTKKYKYSCTLKDEAKYQKIEAEIKVTDNVGNSISYRDYELGVDDIEVRDKDGEIDNYPPIFNSLTLSKTKANVGDIIEITVDAIDVKSGINYIEVYYSNKYGINFIYLRYDSNTNKYKGTIEVKDEDLYTNYIIKGLTIYDNANNQLSKNFNSGYTISITDESNKVDVDTPILRSITVDKNIVKVGEKVKVVAEAIDNTTKIESIVYWYNKGEYSAPVFLIYNSLNDKYEGEIIIDDRMLYRELIPGSLYITDIAGNKNIISGDSLKDLLIKVPDNNGKTDSKAPTLVSLKLDKYTAKVGENVNIIVDAIDDYSGILNVEVMIGKERINLKYNNSTKKFEGIKKITSDELYKKIDITNITIIDNLNNRSDYYYDDITDNKSIMVVDSQGKLDTTKPNLIKYKNVKNIYSQMEHPVIEINASDDMSGVKNVEIYGENSNGNIKYSGGNYESKNGNFYVYMNNYDYDNSLINDKIFISKIIIEDYAGNKVVYDRNNTDLSSLDFIIGNYIDNPIKNININTIYDGDSNITGNVKRANAKVVVYTENYFRKQVMGEGISDTNGNINIKLFACNEGENYTVEVYDLNSNNYLGYANTNVNKSVDITKDGVIDIEDLAKVAMDYGKKASFLGGKAIIQDETIVGIETDINNDTYIDIYDLILVSKRMN